MRCALQNKENNFIAFILVPICYFVCAQKITVSITFCAKNYLAELCELDFGKEHVVNNILLLFKN